MLKRFRSQIFPVLGLDLSPSSVRLVELSGSAGSIHVATYKRTLLPTDAFSGNAIKDRQVIADCIKTICPASLARGKRVVLAVPDSAVCCKTVPMSTDLSEKELEDLVGIEAEQFMALPLSAFHLDFSVQGPCALRPGMQDVFIVASSVDLVSARVQAVSLAGLRVSVVDVESFAVVRALRYLMKAAVPGFESKVLALLNLGYQESHLSIVQHNRLLFARLEAFGANQLSEGILMGVQQGLEYFYSSHPHTVIGHMVLLGELSGLEDLPALIQDRLAFPTRIVNSLAALRSRVEVLEEDVPKLMLPFGLALRGLTHAFN